MSNQLIFLSVSGLVAGVAVLAGLLVLVRRPPGIDAGAAPSLQAVGPGSIPSRRPLAGDGVEVAPSSGPGTPYWSAIRVLWWLASAGVLIGVGMADAFPATRTAIFAVGGLAVICAVVFHEALTVERRTRLTSVVEAFAALGVIAGLLLVTGYGRSPFTPLIVLPVAAVALVARPPLVAAMAALATAAFVAVLGADPARAAFTRADGVAFAAVMGAPWLLAVLAGIYAEHQRRVQAATLERSLTDPLTGLFNRFELMNVLEQELRRTRRSDRSFCLLMIDLDGLKAVNDDLGHARGDAVLRDLGGVIRGSIRVVDSAYRYGGDEFVILLPETDFTGAYVVAEKIRTGGEEVGLLHGGETHPTSVSIGLVTAPADGGTVDELMLAADRALYAAKRAGRNQIMGYRRPRRPAPAPVIAPAPDPGDRSPEAEPDPRAVRRQIEEASLRFDSDHRIRRAMDSLLSPPGDSAGAA